MSCRKRETTTHTVRLQNLSRPNFIIIHFVVAAHEYVVGGCVSAVFSKRNLSIVLPAYIRETNTCSFNGSPLVPAASRGQKITKVESNYFIILYYPYIISYPALPAAWRW